MDICERSLFCLATINDLVKIFARHGGVSMLTFGDMLAGMIGMIIFEKWRKIMKTRNLFLKSVLLASFWAGQAGASVDQFTPKSCQGEADYVFPSVTFVPTTDVVVASGDEFQMEKSADTHLITHVGPARRVRFSSIVAIGKDVEINLRNDGTEYCFVSTVALLGGSIRIKGAYETVGSISAVGDVRIGD